MPYVQPVIVIEGYKQLAVGANGQSEPLSSGVYAVWAAADTHIKVAVTASDVTSSDGYLVRADETAYVRVGRDGLRIGATAACSIHRVST